MSAITRDEIAGALPARERKLADWYVRCLRGAEEAVDVLPEVDSPTIALEEAGGKVIPFDLRRWSDFRAFATEIAFELAMWKHPPAWPFNWLAIYAGRGPVVEAPAAAEAPASPTRKGGRR